MSTPDANSFTEAVRTTAVTAVEKTKTTAVTAVLAERYKTKPKPEAKHINSKAIDYLIDQYADLTKSGKDMSGYYSKVIRIIGEERFRQLAAIARADGRDKPRYFSWLIKREVGPINAS